MWAYGSLCQESKTLPCRLSNHMRKIARAAARKAATENAIKYDKEYKDADKAVVDAKRAAKKAGNFYVDAEAKIAFVIRTRG